LSTEDLFLAGLTLGSLAQSEKDLKIVLDALIKVHKTEEEVKLSGDSPS